MVYKCFNCRKEVDPKQVEKATICPYCGFRILVKGRETKLKKVKAR